MISKFFLSEIAVNKILSSLRLKDKGEHLIIRRILLERL